MGAGNASTGGGGGVGPAGIKKDGTYGTKKDAKKTSSRNEFRTFVKEGGVIGKVVKGITGKTPYETNLESRQKFAKSKGLTSEEINLDPSYLGSKEGLKELRKQGYTTASDVSNNRNDNDNNSILTKSDQPNNSETVTAPSKENLTNPVEKTKTETEKKYDVRKTKKKGKKKNILTSSLGVTKLSPDYSLSNATLLGRIV